MDYRSFLLALAGCCSLHVATAQSYRLQSPDKQLSFTLSVTDSIRYALDRQGQALLAPAAIGISTGTATPSWKVARKSTRTIDQLISPEIRQKSKTIRDHYNELRLDFKNEISLICRAYNNGVAWRWDIRRKGPLQITGEQAGFHFSATDSAWYPIEKSFYSHNERRFIHLPLDSIRDKQALASLPALFDVKGTKLLITESDLFNYAGMWLKGTGTGTLNAVFPHYPKTKEVKSDRDEVVKERESYIAQLNGPQQLPWRLIMVEGNDAGLLDNQLVYQLARPSEGDYSWIRTGKVAWDWWNANNIYQVDFKAGVNTDTYKYYVDFAATNGLGYIILDEGWSDTRDLLKVVPEMNMEALCAYARSKNVGIILWTTWLALDRQLEPALDQFVRWGIKGIKVDFMQRDDQQMVNYYERVAKAAAKRKLLVDFHGAYKPTGWLRSYPHVLTSEGVYGLEQCKWDTDKLISPEHNVTIPFTRMAAGPMDYTPGAMLNAQADSWSATFNNPMSLGTRCHQLAMYVVYESPLQMLADNPTHYQQEPACMAFLQQVPVEWDTTVPLQARVGDYVMIARRAKNGDWYIGAMTDWTPREFQLTLDFLPEGNYRMQLWKDGVNADRNAQDFKTDTLTVNKRTVVPVKLAPGGGWVARIF